MRQFALALALSLPATAVSAAGLAFEPVAPQGLDAEASRKVAALQEGMPGQMPAFEAAGYGAWGALAVPMGVALSPESLVSVANTASAEEAQKAVLDACKAQAGTACTVIGLIVPAGN